MSSRALASLLTPPPPMTTALMALRQRGMRGLIDNDEAYAWPTNDLQ